MKKAFTVIIETRKAGGWWGKWWGFRDVILRRLIFLP
jgi:hypothetical protein